MSTPALPSFEFQHRFLQLPSHFYTELAPTPIQEPFLIIHNEELCTSLNLSNDFIHSDEFLHVLSGNKIGHLSRPSASVYSGHQFGMWAGQLGDGRAILLGDLTSTEDGTKFEVQLKGAGPTPYSRMGDGRAVLRSSIREYLCSEAMHGLGIPTSRALSLVGSKHFAMREQVEKCAIVTRLAPSFIRFGSFEHWYYRKDFTSLKILADFVIQHYYPEAALAQQPYLELLRLVCQRTAKMIAHWQAIGFMHGVMNTDNMSILGITLDYGPFGFMDGFQSDKICNHSDHQGRYSFHNQVAVGQWNCHAFAQSLLPLINDVDATQEVLNEFALSFNLHFLNLLYKKFGLNNELQEDTLLFQDFFTLLENNAADYTLSFRYLSSIDLLKNQKDELLSNLFLDRDSLHAWLIRYRNRLQQENSEDKLRQTSMLAANPKFVLRNHLAQIAIEKAEQNDFSEVEKLARILKHPYDEQIEFSYYAQLPPSWASDIEISCSS
jgi:uncharacterized protein YdiU (UPF0061 family)